MSETVELKTYVQRNMTGRLSVSATLRSLMGAGLVGRIPPENQWSHAAYFLLTDGRAALTSNQEGNDEA